MVRRQPTRQAPPHPGNASALPPLPKGEGVGIEYSTPHANTLSQGERAASESEPGEGVGHAAVQFRHLWGKAKRAQLIESRHNDGTSPYEKLAPPLALGLPFLPVAVARGYVAWPALPEMFPVSFPGVKTSRDNALVDIDRDALVRRMSQYFDPQFSDAQIRLMVPSLMKSTAGFDPKKTRAALLVRGFQNERIVRYCYRPFDLRWLYWEADTKLLDRNRAEYIPHVFHGNSWISAVRHNRREYDAPAFTHELSSAHVIERGANLFPLYLTVAALVDLLRINDPPSEPNLSDAASAYLTALDAEPEHLFFHTLAVLHAPAYRDENKGGLRQDWPRVPLPATRDALTASAELGRKLATLLDAEAEGSGVTTGNLRPELKPIAAISRQGGGGLSDTDLAVTARWGFAGQNGVTMAGPGHAPSRDYTADERKSLAAAGADALTLLGETTRDVFLNDIAYWRCIPERVWTYTLGGYQVLKKWLSYREHALRGRALQPDEARYFAAVARRIAAILLLSPDLDANYRHCAAGAVPLAQSASANTLGSSHAAKRSRRKRR